MNDEPQVGPTTPDDPYPATVAGLTEIIVADPKLSPGKKAYMVGGLKKLMELDPVIATLQPNGRAVVCRFESLTTAATGLSYSRLSNIRSACRRAFKYAAARWKGMASTAGRTPEWQALYDLIRGNQNFTIYLSRFSHWCSGNDIRPDQVCDTVVARFGLYLELVVGEPGPMLRKMAIRWNMCANAIEGWPKTIITLPSTQGPRMAPRVEEFGDLLKADFQAYERLMRTGSEGEDADPFHCEEAEDDELSPEARRRQRKGALFKPYAESTIIGRKDVLRRLIGLAVIVTGIPLSRMRLSDLVTKENASRILKLYRQQMGDPTANILVNSAHALVVLARHFVRVDDATQAKLDEYAAKILTAYKRAKMAGSGGMTAKNRKRLEALGPKQMTALFRLPATLISPVLARVRAGRAKPADLVDAQVAVAIAILLHAPLRSRNTIAIELDRHLRFPPGEDCAHLEFKHTEVKNDVALNFVLPPDATNLVKVYIAEIMPHFGRGRNTKFLFPGLFNDTKAANLLGRQIIARINHDVGVVMNQHLFRHLLALLYLRRCPGQYEIVRILLGHKSVNTTRKYYCGLEAEAALAHFIKIMKELKDETGIDPDDMARLVGGPRRVRATRRKARNPRPLPDKRSKGGGSM